jgi:4-amino-4-deoxy-L-arabinose transferase-like glycosyltransferase
VTAHKRLDRANAPFAAWRERFGIAMLAVATLLVCVYFAPRGFRAGFTDMAHDGYQLRQVLDLDAGGVIFKDTFDQYGPLSGYLNLAGYRLLGHTLVAVKYALGFWYAAIAVLIYRIGRHMLPIGLSVAATVIWLALAPFYQHGIMISPHAYILFFQALGTLALIRFAETERLKYIALVGICCGVCWALKTTMGVLFAAAAIGYLGSRPLRSASSVRDTAMALGTLAAFGLLVVVFTLGWLWTHGALLDWYRQTVAFPKAFYVVERSAQAQASPVSFPVLFAINFLLLNFGVSGVEVALCWHLMRLTVVVAAVILGRRRSAPEPLLIIAFITPALWPAAYPSANFMHQWWTASLTIPAFVYCVHLGVRKIRERAPHIAVRSEAWATVAVLVVVFWSSVSERIVATRQRADSLTETLEEPRALKGIRTDKRTAEGFHAIYAAMVNFKQHHPTARVVSNDHCNGFSNCVAESLLWLSFLDDNRHDHPIYWPMPVLSTTLYPDYNQRFQDSIERAPALIVDSWTGPNLPDNGIAGYELLVGVRMPSGYWYVFAPIHPEAAAHGEVATRLDESGDPPGMRQSNSFGWRHTFEDAVDPATGVVHKLPLYTWPIDLDVPPLRKVQPLDMKTIEARVGSVTVDGDGWIVRGDIESPYSSLLEFGERRVRRGDYFLATGTVREGNCRFMLMRDGALSGFVDIPNPGPFAVMLMPPTSGRYRLLFTNGFGLVWWHLAQERGLPGLVDLLFHGVPRQISFDVDQAGWVTKDSQMPVSLVYQRHHPPMQLDSDEQIRAATAAAERADAEEQLAEQRREAERRAEERLAEQRRRTEQRLAAAKDMAEPQSTIAADGTTIAAEHKYQMLIHGPRRKFEHVIDAETGRQRDIPLYTWPPIVDIPEPLPEPGLLDASTAQRGPTLRVEDNRWTMRGSAVSRFAYLLRFDDQPLGKGDSFVATGTIEEGGLTFGLQQNEKWVGMANVTQPGPFAVVLTSPLAGRYTLVVANNVLESTTRELIRRHGLFGVWSALSGATLPNVFQIDRAGWIRKPLAPVDTTPTVATAQVPSQRR